MGQVLHGSATTTEAFRRTIQHSQESLRALAKRYGINEKTVAKWKKRASVADVSTGPKEAHSTVLSLEDEAVVVAFRRHTLLPLDDCLYALQPTLPHLAITIDKLHALQFRIEPQSISHALIARSSCSETHTQVQLNHVAAEVTRKFN